MRFTFFFRIGCCSLFLLLPAGECALSQTTATEIPKGSSLRQELFDLARPEIQKQVGRPFRFNGNLRRSGDWAFFLGNVVDANGKPILHPESGSADACVLWQKNNAEWKVVEFFYGFTDVPFGDWSKIHAAPATLFLQNKIQK